MLTSSVKPLKCGVSSDSGDLSWIGMGAYDHGCDVLGMYVTVCCQSAGTCVVDSRLVECLGPCAYTLFLGSLFSLKSAREPS